MEKFISSTYRKGLVAFIFCNVIFVVILSSTYAISGCAGDCLTCHENLVGDETHISLSGCASCHVSSAQQSIKKELSLFQGSLVNGGCGDRCFTCHSYWPKDSFHADLDTCLECHSA